MSQSIRVLMVDDFIPLREFARKSLRRRPDLNVVAEAADGLEAVRMAHQHQPDLVLLDISLPALNGIQAARRILELSPHSRIIFLTELRAFSFAEEALGTGACGYVVKSDAPRELLPAIDAVLKGAKYISSSIEDRDAVEPAPARSPRFHEAAFFSGSQGLVDHASAFLSSSLIAADSILVVATESHLSGILSRLSARHDVDSLLQQGRCTLMHAQEAVAAMTRNGRFDPDGCLAHFAAPLKRASEASRGSQRRVSAFGESSSILCAQGNAEAALQLELWCNRIAGPYNLRMLSGFSAPSLEEHLDPQLLQQIRDAHSAVHFH
ncbi:MAG TPA: response regulator [Terracidiphilus sp.]